MKTQIDADPARRLNNVLASLVLLSMGPGLFVLGWRATLAVVTVILVAMALRRAMRQERLPAPRRWPPTWPLETLLLCGMLPADLAAAATPGGRPNEFPWMVLPSAAIVLVLMQRIRQALPWPSFDPVVVTLLLLHVALGPALDPRAALDRDAMLRGDLVASVDAPTPDEAWFQRPGAPDDAPGLRVPWAARRLDDYLSGRLDAADAARGSNLDSLIRDKLPPIEDLMLLGHPMPIGATSGIALLGLLLWASYRKLIDWRTPLVSLAACYVCLAILPTPTSISVDGRNWRALPAAHVDVGVATGLTFVHYLIFASPTLYVFGLIAARGDVRPLHGRATLAWAAMLGAANAAAMLYVSVILGPLLVALPAPVLARWADRLLARWPLSLPQVEV
jgi:hypothetical protein